MSNCDTTILIILAALLFGFLAYKCLRRPMCGVKPPAKETHEQWNARRYKESCDVAEAAAQHMPATHIVRKDQEDHPAYEHAGTSLFVSKRTGKVLGYRYKLEVLEILNMTPEQRKDKKELVDLFWKMIMSKKAKTGWLSMAMHPGYPMITAMLDYGQSGPSMVVEWWRLRMEPDGGSCEITTAERKAMSEAIETRNTPKKMDRKKVADLL